MIVDIKISTVKTGIIEELAVVFDFTGTPGKSNWKDLAHELIDEKSYHEIKYLDKEIKPGLEFLSKLTRRDPEVTVKDFQKICEQGYRHDIIKYISKMNKNILLCNLDLGSKREIASFLNLSETPGLKNWKWFCEKYNFDHIEMKRIENASTAENKNISPTKNLFELLRQSKPNMTTGTVIKACEKIDRKDAVIILKKAYK